MSSEENLIMMRARRAYELGRARGALVRGFGVATLAMVVNAALARTNSFRWALLSFAIWSIVWWRGGALLKAGYAGLAAGALTYLCPISLLRPCCHGGVAGVHPTCTMPEACVIVGALVTAPIAALVLRRCERRDVAALGLLAGALTVASAKCSALVMGEALGLFAGLALGLLAAMAVDVIAPRLSRS